jgi:D-alanine-D-alanine ligase
LRKPDSSPKIAAMTRTKRRVLVLWNQTEEDIYERFKEEGPRPLTWNPDQVASEVGTVQEEMDTLVEAVRAAGHEVTCVNLQDDTDRLIEALRTRPDTVFNLVEYFHDDENLEPNIPAVIELFGLPYTGNQPLTLGTCQRKFRTKLILEAAGLPTPAYFLVDQEPVPDPLELELDYPLIVKPAREDASGGIEPSSVVQDYPSLVERVRYVLTEFKQPALVEEYIDGREIHAAIIGNANPEVLPLFEMEFDDSEFNPDGEWRPQIISYHAKWDPHSPEFYSMDAVCPAEDLDPDVEDYIREIAVSAFRAMGCRDYARIDMRLDEYDEPYILEVNPNPDLADGSAFLMCAEASGRTYAQTIGEIVAMALDRADQMAAAAAKKADAPKPEGPSDHLLRKYSRRRRPSTERPDRSSTRADTAPPDGPPRDPADPK